MNSEKVKYIPYAEITHTLLKYIFHLLHCYYDFKKVSPDKVISAENEKVKKIFNELRKELKYDKYKNDGINNHLKDGIYPSDFAPRLLKLIVQSCKNAEEKEKKASEDENSNKKKQQGKLMPSPLSILYHYLTVPEEPQSAAYAVSICRAILFTLFKAHPSHPDLASHSHSFKIYEEISPESVQQSVGMFRSHAVKKRDNVKATPENKTNLICTHYLAMKEIFYLRFKDVEDRLEYLLSENLNGTKKDGSSVKYEFRLSSDYTDIPNVAETINYLWGIPLPIRGADTVFFGGLKKDAQSSIVMSVSGEAGIGKTSFALGLAGCLSPFSTKCCYLTLEEDPADLKIRLLSLIPDYLKKLSIYNIDDWFRPMKFDLNEKTNIGTFTSFFDLIKKESISQDNSVLENYLPPICPLIIVIDSITGTIIDENKNNPKKLYEELENFIRKCRELRAMIVLLSGENLPKEVKLDYLVDVVINLKHENTDKFDIKPVRNLQLLKTRHQISRPGAHIFHLSGNEGFRISPQIPSQIDKKEKVKRPLPNKENIIQTLNIYDGNGYLIPIPNKKFVDFYNYSQILIHGRGSSGKAGLALKILLSPPIDKETLKQPFAKLQNDKVFQDTKYSRKVLIVSFLFDKEYYEELEKRVNNKFEKTYSGLRNHKIECLYFFPGFLSPEDLVNKIIRKLDTEKLKGEPFTGILLDGLHNVFLQFPSLQDRDIVWPMLYSVLVRYKLNIVTTFTTFSLAQDDFGNNNNSDNNKRGIQNLSYDDQILLKKGHTPFLHALVQATDFYIAIEPKESPQGKVIYEIRLKNAMDQVVTNDRLEWNKNDLLILNQKLNQPEIPFQKVNEKG